MFDGNIAGSIAGILFYLVFQLAGIFLVLRILAKENFSIVFRFLIGSVAGTLAFQWFPVIFAFSFGFTLKSHILGLVLLFSICIITWVKTEKTGLFKSNPYYNIYEWLRFFKENPCIILMAVIFIYFVYCLSTHTIPVNSDGSIHTGQATYGDMNMHLGFITSIANQKSFPPDYSIFPGTKLAYPFLCDSISSSLYISGASLRTAYIFPMLVAVCQVMGGFYCFIKYWFKSAVTAFIAWIMFFLNGGLGFIYFMDKDSIARNFTDFYYTPTSLGDKNFRWAQIIANMLLPQRATLFGFAVLFPLLALFLYGMRKKSRLCFIISGIFAGALPMIHTHSFLGFGLACTMWLFFNCKELCGKIQKHNLAWIPFLAVIAFFTILQKINEKDDIISSNGLLIMGAGIFVLAIYIFIYIIRVVQEKQWKMVLSTWGVFLAIVIILALPQLIIWTFGQAGTEGFIRGHFNWSNTDDGYIWFYIKNIGIVSILFIAGILFTRRKNLWIASPVLLIWFISELVVFQPNEYDNNKLLFIGYIFICGIAADFVTMMFSKNWLFVLKVTAGAAMVFTGVISALLTLGREWVSDYELYSVYNVEACQFIEKNTEPDAVVLTATNHNNAVPSLTGRNIVCGASTFLYYHGINYYGREADIPVMYEDPVSNYNLYKKYNVDYIYISNAERNSYAINEDGLLQIASCIYSNEETSIYKLNG